MSQRRAALLVVLTILNLGSAATVAALFTMTNSVKETLAFSCGYLYGQVGMIRHGGLRIAEPVPPPTCENLRRTAITNGFGTAEDDGPGRQL